MKKLMESMRTYAVIRQGRLQQIKICHEDRLWFSLERANNQFLYTDSAGRQRLIPDISEVEPEVLMTPMGVKLREAFEPGEKTRADLHRIFANCQVLSDRPEATPEYFDPVTARNLNPENS